MTESELSDSYKRIKLGYLSLILLYLSTALVHFSVSSWIGLVIGFFIALPLYVYSYIWLLLKIRKGNVNSRVIMHYNIIFGLFIILIFIELVLLPLILIQNK